MQEYVRKLLYKDLSKTTTEKVYPGHYIKITFLKGKWTFDWNNNPNVGKFWKVVCDRPKFIPSMYKQL